MDHTAIQLIQDTAIDAAGKNVLDFNTSVAIIRNDQKLVSLEPFGARRDRFRGKLSTTSLSDFILYTQKHLCDGKPAVFIDGKSLAATAFFNLGDNNDPGHADDKAVLALDKTAPYAALLGIHMKRTNQKALSEWLEDWADYLAALGLDGGSLSLTAAIAAIRKITVQSSSQVESSVRQFSESRSALEEIEARSSAGLPTEFIFECVPYLGLPTRQFRLRLAIFPDDKQVQLQISIRQLEAHLEDIAQDFKGLLLRDLAETANITIGTFEA